MTDARVYSSHSTYPLILDFVWRQLGVSQVSPGKKNPQQEKVMCLQCCTNEDTAKQKIHCMARQEEKEVEYELGISSPHWRKGLSFIFLGEESRQEGVTSEQSRA